MKAYFSDGVNGGLRKSLCYFVVAFIFPQKRISTVTGVVFGRDHQNMMLAYSFLLKYGLIFVNLEGISSGLIVT